MTDNQATALRTHVVSELRAYRSARTIHDRSAAWRSLERAHILSQPLLGAHLRVHAEMFLFALRVKDFREVAGQVMRLALAPLGALVGRLPSGNSGRARVSAFEPAAIPTDLIPLLSAAGVHAVDKSHNR